VLSPSSRRVSSALVLIAFSFLRGPVTYPLFSFFRSMFVAGQGFPFFIDDGPSLSLGHVFFPPFFFSPPESRTQIPFYRATIVSLGFSPPESVDRRPFSFSFFLFGRFWPSLFLFPPPSDASKRAFLFLVKSLVVGGLFSILTHL